MTANTHTPGRAATLFERVDSAASYGLVLAGLVHTALTPLTELAAGQSAIWFAGSGQALATLGLINLARLAAPNTRVRWLCAIANLASLPFLLAVASMLPAPHVLLVLSMAAFATVRSLRPPLPEDTLRR